MTDHVTQEEWEALHLLNRESGMAPGDAMVSHLERRGLINSGLALTLAGRDALEAYRDAYPRRAPNRSFIGSGR